MKKACYTFLVLLFTTGLIIADNDFSYDAKQVEKTFSKLDKLEQMHFAQPSASLDELTSNSEFEGVSISAGTINMVVRDDAPPVLPAFWWGCILGAIGILIVYLITESREQTTKAVYGCLAWGVFIALWWVFAVFVLGGSFWLW
jgi:hypothetical protein